jgi:hypothetical protein
LRSEQPDRPRRASLPHSSLPLGIGVRDRYSDTRRMSAAVLTNAAPAQSTRLLADVNALGGQDDEPREPALIRLEEALGRDFADRLVAALSHVPER